MSCFRPLLPSGGVGRHPAGTGYCLPMENTPEHDTLANALAAQGIEATRWPSFLAALNQLESSEIVRAR